MHTHPVKQPNLTRKFPLNDMPTGLMDAPVTWLAELVTGLQPSWAGSVIPCVRSKKGALNSGMALAALFMWTHDLHPHRKENSMSGMSDKERDRLKDSEFAFPKERKEPINDEEHIRAAVARFDQVEGVTNEERDDAWERIVKAAKKYGVALDENDWRELYRRNGRQVPQD
jgi:hypothetical protein